MATVPEGVQVPSSMQNFPAGVVTKETALRVPTRPMPDVQASVQAEFTKVPLNGGGSVRKD